MTQILSFGKRRIIGMNYSRLVCLPIDWLNSIGVDKGNEVEITLLEDGSLRIQKG